MKPALKTLRFKSRVQDNLDFFLMRELLDAKRRNDAWNYRTIRDGVAEYRAMNAERIYHETNTGQNARGCHDN